MTSSSLCGTCGISRLNATEDILLGPSRWWLGPDTQKFFGRHLNCHRGRLCGCSSNRCRAGGLIQDLVSELVIRELLSHLVSSLKIFLSALPAAAESTDQPGGALGVCGHAQTHARENAGFSDQTLINDKPHMGGCQNFGPLLGPLIIRCRIILRTPKRDHNLDNHPYVGPAHTSKLREWMPGSLWGGCLTQPSGRVSYSCHQR